MSTPDPQNTARPSNRGAIVALCGLVAVLLVGFLFWYSAQRADGNFTPESTSQLTAPHANSEGTAIVVNPGKTRANAPVVTIYQDYQCPACADVEAQLGEPLNSLANKGQIQLQYATMTFLDTTLKSDSSVRAARAAACADVQGVYGRYHDAIFARQPSVEGTGYTEKQLTTTFAEQAGLSGASLKEFRRCYINEQTSDFVTMVAKRAATSGVTATPTYLVDGKQLDLTALPDFSEATLKAEIDRVAASA